jgi:hypothetical protein
MTIYSPCTVYIYMYIYTIHCTSTWQLDPGWRGVETPPAPTLTFQNIFLKFYFFILTHFASVLCSGGFTVNKQVSKQLPINMAATYR